MPFDAFDEQLYTEAITENTVVEPFDEYIYTEILTENTEQ